MPGRRAGGNPEGQASTLAYPLESLLRPPPMPCPVGRSPHRARPLFPCCFDPSSFASMPPVSLQDSNTQLLRERAETILWIKKQMARYGLHLADLQNAGCFSKGASLANAPARPICFRLWPRVGWLRGSAGLAAARRERWPVDRAFSCKAIGCAYSTEVCREPRSLADNSDVRRPVESAAVNGRSRMSAFPSDLYTPGILRSTSACYRYVVARMAEGPHT
ncbi:hypothetical protein D9M68_103690 [compost metagenome]